MVFFITIAGCPVSGSSHISSGNSFYDFYNEDIYKKTTTTTLIPYYYPENDLSQITGDAFSEWFNKFVESSGLKNNSIIINFMAKMKYNSFFINWDEVNLTFESLGYRLTFNETDNAGTKSTSDDSKVFGSNTSTRNNNISITFDPTCTGDNCYQGNGDTGSGNSGNTPTPPQPP